MEPLQQQLQQLDIQGNRLEHLFIGYNLNICFAADPLRIVLFPFNGLPDIPLETRIVWPETQLQEQARYVQSTMDKFLKSRIGKKS